VVQNFLINEKVISIRLVEEICSEERGHYFFQPSIKYNIEDLSSWSMEMVERLHEDRWMVRREEKDNIEMLELMLNELSLKAS